MKNQNNISKIAVILVAIMLIASSVVFWSSGGTSDMQDNNKIWFEDYKCAISEGINPNSIIYVYSSVYCDVCEVMLEEVKYWENQSITFIKIDYIDKNSTEFKKILGCYGQYVSDGVPLMFCASNPRIGFVGRAVSRDLMSQFIYLCRSHADEALLSLSKPKDKQK